MNNIVKKIVLSFLEKELNKLNESLTILNKDIRKNTLELAEKKDNKEFFSDKIDDMVKVTKKKHDIEDEIHAFETVINKINKMLS